MRIDLRNAKPGHRSALILVGAVASFSVLVAALSQFYWASGIQLTPVGAVFGRIDQRGIIAGCGFSQSDVFWNAGASGQYGEPSEYPRYRRNFLTGPVHDRTEDDRRLLISLPGLEFWHVPGPNDFPKEYVTCISHWWVMASTAVAYLATGAICVMRREM
jgi:hypothetical protein